MAMVPVHGGGHHMLVGILRHVVGWGKCTLLGVPLRV